MKKLVVMSKDKYDAELETEINEAEANETTETPEIAEEVNEETTEE